MSEWRVSDFNRCVGNIYLLAVVLSRVGDLHPAFFAPVSWVEKVSNAVDEWRDGAVRLFAEHDDRYVLHGHERGHLPYVASAKVLVAAAVPSEEILLPCVDLAVVGRRGDAVAAVDRIHAQ